MTLRIVVTVTCDGCGRSHEFEGVVSSIAPEQHTVLREEGWTYDTERRHWCGTCTESRRNPQMALAL